MTPRENFRALMGGGQPDYVPFIFRNGSVPAAEINERILEIGACLLNNANAYSTEIKNVRVEETTFIGDNGRERRKKSYVTPHGELVSVDVRGEVSWWMEEPIFKDQRDYKALFYLLENYEYQPSFEVFKEEDRQRGDLGIGRAITEKNPFFEMMHNLMGIETLAYEWNDNRGMILELYRLLLENRRRRLEIVAKSPAEFVVIDGNIEMSVVGPERFQEYYVPVIEEASELLHANGKKTGLHLDSNNRLFLEPVSRLSVDFIESFTPPPDCDITVKEALEAWPDKILLLNFPSSVHLSGVDAVVDLAERLLAEGGDRIAMGFHENVPKFDAVVPLVEATVDTTFG